MTKKPDLKLPEYVAEISRFRQIAARFPTDPSGLTRHAEEENAMSTLRGISGIATVAVLIAGLAACAPPPPSPVMSIPQSRGPAEVRVAPPPPEAEVIPPPPPGEVETMRWDPGHWRWADGQWVWVHGHYIERPGPMANWIPGHWDQTTDGGWVWEQGHWM